MSDSQSLIQALQVSTEVALSEVNTMMPGQIVSYDPARNRAVVRPIQPKRLADGGTLEPPNVVEVPVVWTASQGGSVAFTAPLKEGDGVMLVFAQRSLENYLSGNNTAPDDPRRFDLSDCVAQPGLQASGIAANPDDVEFRFGPVKLRLRPDGSGRMETAGGSWTIGADGNVTYTGTIFVDGDAIVKGDVRAGTVSLKTHRHLASGGTGIGGPPQT